jgi:hypothetical protein
VGGEKSLIGSLPAHYRVGKIILIDHHADAPGANQGREQDSGDHLDFACAFPRLQAGKQPSAQCIPCHKNSFVSRLPDENTNPVDLIAAIPNTSLPWRH